MTDPIILPFMREGTGRPLDRADLDRLGALLGVIDGQASVGAATEGRRHALPFYRSTSLVVLSDAQWRPEGVRIYLLEGPDNLLRLQGTSPPIHQVNASEPVALSDQNILEYLAFFCFFVHGEDGPFFICDSAKNPFLPADRSVAEHLEPPRFFGMSPEGHWRITAIVYYSNGLFRGDFEVEPAGMPRLREDVPYLTDLPNRIVSPLTLERSRVKA